MTMYTDNSDAVEKGDIYEVVMTSIEIKNVSTTQFVSIYVLSRCVVREIYMPERIFSTA